MSQSIEANRNLRLDRIVSSQSELGPSIPDGGYGWVILVASLFLQVLIPSILASYGIFMLYFRLENSALSNDPKIWDIALMPTPIIFMAFSTVAEPCNKLIVASSSWPRLVATTGIFLSCAGLLIQWIAMRDTFGVSLYILAGALSGFGSSLALMQSEILISQYFRLKLSTVNNILICAYTLGFIIVPIVLGFIILHKGILHGLLVYQAIILQCVLAISFFKKPLYLKAVRRQYELLQNASEDDEMIFAKDEIDISNTELKQTENNLENHKKSLHDSFARDFALDLGSVTTSQTNEPSPIFLESTEDIHTYAFDNNVAVDNNRTRLVPSTEKIVLVYLKTQLIFLRKLSFYKSFIFLLSVKYTFLIFWMLFPTYLYVENSKLKIQQTTFIVGSMGLGSLIIGLFLSIFPLFGKNKQILVSTFCLLSSVGYIILSDSDTEGWMIFGALLITTSLTVMQSHSSSVIKYILKENTEKASSLLHVCVGISLLFLMIQDITYRNCFRIVGVMQLLAGVVILIDCFNNLFSR